MADIFSLLGNDDLTTFGQQVSGSDPLSALSQSLGNWQPNTSSWSPSASLGTAFGKAFLTGYLGNMARQNQADQINKVTSVLPSLYSNPMSTSAPEGVDVDAFAALRNSVVSKQASLGALESYQKRTRAGELAETLFGKVAENPYMANKVLDAAGKFPTIADALGLKATVPAVPVPSIEGAAVPAVTADPNAPKALPVMLNQPIPGALAPVLNSGRKSAADREMEYTQRFMETGNYTPSQAAQSARQKVEGEVKANAKSFDEAKAARDRANKLINMSSQAEAALEKVGETGKGQGMEDLFNYVASPFSQKASEKLDGSAQLDSIGASIVSSAREPGSGATDRFESQMYLASGPNKFNPTETNRLLIQKAKDLAKLDLDYADFVDTYREQNDGSTVGADKLWQQYKRDNPLFVKVGDETILNTQKPSWQEYFSGQTQNLSPAVSGLTNDAATPQYVIKTAPNGQRYKVLVGQ